MNRSYVSGNKLCQRSAQLFTAINGNFGRIEQYAMPGQFRQGCACTRERNVDELGKRISLPLS
jgi:hypothetical protein